MIKRPSVDWLITQMDTIGGAEKFAFLMLQELTRRNWDIRLITILEDHGLSDRLREDGIPVLTLSAKSKIDFGVWKKLEAIWRNRKPLILHTHLYHAAILGRLVGKRMGIPIVLCHQGGPELSRSYLRTILDRLTSALVDRYIVPCWSVANVLNSREKIPLEKIVQIPNAISPIEYMQENNSYLVEGRRFGDFVRLVTVGRLVYEKAQHVMIESLYLMAMRNFRARLLFIGNGPMRQTLENMVSQYHLNESVSFLGYQDNPMQGLSQADIFILTSLWESLSLAIMEAMSLGMPVIATATGGTPELITHMENGYLIPPNSPSALADAIEFLHHNPNLAQQMGKNAQKHILENYTVPKVADKLEELYIQLFQ